MFSAFLKAVSLNYGVIGGYIFIKCLVFLQKKLFSGKNYLSEAFYL